MTFFSRCEATQCFEPGRRPTSSNRSRTSAESGGFLQALSGFLEDIGILCRYAAGLDYYDRDRAGMNR